MKIALMAVSISLCPLCGQNCLANTPADDLPENHYIYDKNFPAHKMAKPSAGHPYLSGGMVTTDALDLFRSLERQYAVNSIDEISRHYEGVRQDLHARFQPADAQLLFENYKTFLACQIALVNDSRFETKSMDPKELLAQLSQIQNFRREKLGRETADALFGKKVKDHEYLLRRLIIIGSPDRYGKEKEKHLQKLKEDMWGGENVSIGEDQEPYNLYEQKLQIYARDLSETDEINRRQKIEEFRKEYFTPEQIDRLRKADAEVAAEEEHLKRYRAEENKILQTTGMSQDQQDGAIKALQDQYFGTEADAFRRREAMLKGTEK